MIQQQQQQDPDETAKSQSGSIGSNRNNILGSTNWWNIPTLSGSFDGSFFGFVNLISMSSFFPGGGYVHWRIKTIVLGQ
eukprot:scaffold5130_cov76-Cylindrotheca_fusiformis.AAC.1